MFLVILFMAKWKISFDTLMELKEGFVKFTNSLENEIARQYRMDKDNAVYTVNKLRRDSYYMTENDLENTLDKYLDEAKENKNRMLRLLQETIDNFTFFIDVLEFDSHSSQDFGHDIVVDFYKCTIQRVRNYDVPSNNFRVVMKGITWKINGDYSWFKF